MTGSGASVPGTPNSQRGLWNGSSGEERWNPAPVNDNAVWRRQIVQPGKARAPEGFLVDAHALVLGTTKSIDVFRGILVVLVVFANSLLTIGSAEMLDQPGSGCLLICNAAASQVFAGCMLAFGYSAYTQFLRVWPDPPRIESWQVLKTMIFPILCAWIISFTWRFLAPERAAVPNEELQQGSVTASLLRVVIFQGAHAGGPDLLLASSMNFVLVFLLWRPINFIMSSIESGWRHDILAVLIAISPLAICWFPLQSCGETNVLALFWPCGTEEKEIGAVPGLPHLMDFNLGLLAAACWDRFLCQLRPYGGGGSNLHILPWETARRWGLGLVALFGILSMLFVPLGQVMMSHDLFHTEVQTPFGSLQRGPSGGPSALWMLASLWPTASWAVCAVVLVSYRGSPLIGSCLHYPLSFLEHLGANVLYYVVFLNIMLAGLCARHRIYGHKSANDKDQSGLCESLVAALLILCAGRFLHFIAKMARK